MKSIHFDRQLRILERNIQSKDKSVQQKALQSITTIINQKDLTSTLNYFKKKGNTFSIIIKALGNSNNTSAIEALINCYSSSNHHYRRLILKSLLKLGAFSSLVDGNQTHPNIEKKVWAMVFGYSSKQLNEVLKLDKQSFQSKIDFAWKTFNHKKS